MVFFKSESIDEQNIRFSALEDELDCGFCLMKINADFAEVFELGFDEDKPYLVEGLLRSAYNYASLKGIYMGRCTCKNIDAFLERMNFEKADGVYFNDIPSILMGSCCK